MTFKDIMKYIESEYSVVNKTPCEICGGKYQAEDLEIAFIDDVPFDVFNCTCSKCGHEKTFQFNAPFIEDDGIKTCKKFLN